MRQLESGSISAVVTDPPYGLGTVKDLPGLLRAWMAGEDDGAYRGKSGFMNSEWDAGVPGPRYWKEVHRVMKDGAHLLCFGGTRTWDLMTMALRLAGFEIRDTIEWIHGQGFNKHGTKKFRSDFESSLGEKVAERRRAHGMVPIAGPESYLPYAGFACQIKPAHEPVVMARKPPSEPSVARQVLATGTGALNIDASRIEGLPRTTHADGNHQGTSPHPMDWGMRNGYSDSGAQGRWPSNLLLQHSPGCERAGTKRVKPGNGSGVVGKAKGGTRQVYGHYDVLPEHAGFTKLDPDGFEEVERWVCVDGCPVRELDSQSGVRKSGGSPASANNIDKSNQAVYQFGSTINKSGPHHGGQGGASRYFKCFEPDAGPGFFYALKAPSSERWGFLKCKANGHRVSDPAPVASLRALAGQGHCDECGDDLRVESHPAQKPAQTLMRYLVKLVTPPGGTVLDPFAGSFSTGVACVLEDFNFIGIEQDQGYCEIGSGRLAWARSSCGKTGTSKPDLRDDSHPRLFEIPETDVRDGRE